MHTLMHTERTRVCLHTHASQSPVTPLPCFPAGCAESCGHPLQEISKDAVDTISSKEIIIIITLSDLAVKFL